MSKVYEALEHARRELHGVPRRVDEPAHLPVEQPPEAPVAAAPTVPLFSVAPELNLEREMTDLYQSINSLLSNVDHKVIQFISSRSGEGASTIVRELANVITVSMGRSALLLDIDRRSPNLRTFFDCTPPGDLDEVLKGTLPIDRAICHVEDTTLSVSPLFQHAMLSSQKVDSQGIDQLWDQLRQRFDYILIDSPPISASSDGLAIVGKADGVVLVVEAEKTRWPVAQVAKEKIVSHGGNLLGMVFNKRRFYIPEFVYKRV